MPYSARSINNLLRLNQVLDSGFVLGPDTPGAEMQLLGFAVNHDGGGMNIGIKAAVSMLLRMTDVLTEHRAFSTYIALQGKFSFDF
jgi:hypothetical protein